MTTTELPSFDDALQQFRAFIQSQGHGADLLWLFREDVVQRRRKVGIERRASSYVRKPIDDDTMLVERKYQEGLRRGLGMQLGVFCFLGERPCCYIWLPRDQEEAQYRMLNGLTMNLPAEPERQIVTPVKCRLRWYWLKAIEAMESDKSKPNWADELLPKRSWQWEQYK